MPSEHEHLPITGAEITTVAKAIGGVRRALRRPDPVAVLKRRAEVREEIRTNLYAKDANWGKPPEIIVIKIGTHDDYPNTDRRLYGRGASDWFKGEVKGLHDRGIEVFASIEHVLVHKGKARRVSYTRPESCKVWVVGRIPYERVAWIDWEPDPAYAAPRFYVAYTFLRHEAYRDVVLYEGNPDRFLYEIHGVKYIGGGGGPIRRVRRALDRIRFNVEDRRQEKDWDG
jgi:hypothetical protein